MNLPTEIVNRILYFASLHNNKKYVPEFNKKGKLYWKLNFQHSVFNPLNSLYQFRSLNRVKEYTRVFVVPSVGVTDTYLGIGFPLCETKTTYTEFISLKHINTEFEVNDIWPNSALITYSKPNELAGNTVYVNGTLYTNVLFNAHGDTMPTLVDVDKITADGGSELILGINTNQYWQFNPILLINEYIINVNVDLDDDVPEEVTDEEVVESSQSDNLEWEDVMMESISPYLIGYPNGSSNW
jgi:hypothetical protein